MSLAAEVRKIVLVVEDEPILRMAGVDMVESAGFEALDAADAIDAVRILETRPDVRIVFTDIDMPRGVDGMALAACIRVRWPPIDIILTSGHIETEKLVMPTGALFFPKPYRERDVVAAMKRMSNAH